MKKNVLPGYIAVQAALESVSNAEIAEHSQRFFKSGPGEYGEGDVFRGIRVPVVRQWVREFPSLTEADLEALLESEFHEDRLFALLWIVRDFEQARSDESRRKRWFDFYLAHSDRINNWDLVDTSAHKIVGSYLLDRSRKRLDTLSKSSSLWERRIAIVSTWRFIQLGQLEDTWRISDRLLKDPEDLIHKAVGWMLREAGKKSLAELEVFLETRAEVMPRVMLRYAIEKMDDDKRKMYLQKGK